MTPRSGGTITRCIPGLKNGDHHAFEVVWLYYYRRVVRRAQLRLAGWGTPRRGADEEDVAQIAFNSFYEGVKRGRFPQLDDQKDLWRILRWITDCKAADLARREQQELEKRDTLRGRFSDKDEWEGSWEPDPGAFLNRVEQVNRLIDLLVEPERRLVLAKLAAEIGVEEVDRLMGPLDDDFRLTLLKLKDERCTSKKLAEVLGCSIATVNRDLHGIRMIGIELGLYDDRREDETPTPPGALANHSRGTRRRSTRTAAGPRDRQLPESTGVLEVLDQPMPMGMASEIGRPGGSLAVWRLISLTPALARDLGLRG
jgi:DNA-directed RNA polymerase specialized sigma24 family protein